MNAIEKEIYDLLTSNWNASNTSDVTPEITTGWYDEERELPQVSVTTPNEAPETETGFTSIAADSGTPVQQQNGIVDCHIWATEPSSPDGTNVKQLLFEMQQEAKRIVNANWNNATDYEFISWFGGRQLVESERQPSMYHYAGEVGYAYRD